jgi:WD40 repeat protein
MASRWLWRALGVLLVGCASSPRRPEPPAARAPAAPSCASPLAEQGRQALEAGRLERARRLFRGATEDCPEDQLTRQALLSTLVTLGDRQEASALAGRIEQDEASAADERVHARRLVDAMPPVRTTQALSWVREGTAALARGDHQGGRWLLDRALVALERDQAPATLSLPNGPLGSLPWRPPTRSPLARRSRPVLAASEDGRLLAFGEGPLVRVVDAASGREVNALPLRGTSARALAFAPGGGEGPAAPALAVLATDRTLRLWNLYTGREQQLDAGDARELAGFTARGLVLEGEGSVEVRDPGSGHQEVVSGKLRGLDRGGRLLVEQGGRVALRGAAGAGKAGAGSGGSGWSVGSGGSGWSVGAAASVLLAPDGGWVASAGVGPRESVEVASLKEGARRWTLRAPVPGPYRLVAASASGARLLAEAGGQVILWEVEGGEVEVREGWRPAGFVGETALLEQEGRWALWRAGARDPRELRERPGDRFRELLAVGPLLLTSGGHEATFQLRDPQSGAPLRAVDALHAEALQTPSALPHGALAGVDPDGSVRLLWPDRGAQAQLPAAGNLTLGVAFVGSSLAAFAEGQLRTFDAEDGRLLALRERPLVGKRLGAFGAGRLLATLAPHGWLQIFDVAAGQTLKILEGSRMEKTVAVALSPDGRWVAAGERDGGLRIWDVERGGEPLRVLRDHRSHVQALAFLGPGRLCSGDEGGAVFCRDLPDGPPVPLRPATPLGEVTALAPTEEGELLVVARSLLGVRVRVFDREQGAQLRSLGELLPVDGEGVAVRGKVLLAPSTISGSTLLLRVRDGVPLGALRVQRDGRGAYFLAPSGAIELLGGSLRGVGVCRVGHRSFPAELCLDRFEQPGLLRRALGGEAP